MPDDPLHPYQQLHGRMAHAIAAEPPRDEYEPAINYLDDEERLLEAEPDDEIEMVAVDVETGEIDLAALEEPDAPAEEIDYAEIVKQAFLDAFEKNGGSDVRRRFEATLSRAENWDDFLAGVMVGIPTGVVKDVVEQVTWIVSLLTEVFEGMPEAATGAAQTWSDIVDWVSDPELWAAARDLYAAAPGSDEFMRALVRLRDKLPPWVLTVAEAVAQLYDVAHQVPDLLEDEEFRVAALVTCCHALAGTTESLVKVLDTGDNKPDLQGEAVGIIIGQFFSYALITLLLGAVRLPAKLGVQAVEAGVGIAKGFTGAATSVASVTSRHARMVGAGIEPALAKLKDIIKKRLADKSRQRGAVDLMPWRGPKKPTGKHPGGQRGPKYDPRLPPAIQTAVRRAGAITAQYGGKAFPYHVLREKAVKPLNALSQVGLRKPAARRQRKRNEVHAHHSVEKQFLKLFTLRERKALGWVPKTKKGGGKMKASDSMPAVLAMGEGHVGFREALKNRAGNVMQSDVLRGGKLPSLNTLDEFVKSAKPKTARDVIDAHERYYRFTMTKAPFVWTDAKGKVRYDRTAQKHLKMLLDSLEEVRRTLDEKAPGWRDR